MRAYSNQALMAIHIVAVIEQLACMTRGDLWNRSKAQVLWSLDKGGSGSRTRDVLFALCVLRDQPGRGRSSGGHLQDMSQAPRLPAALFGGTPCVINQMALSLGKPAWRIQISWEKQRTSGNLFLMGVISSSIRRGNSQETMMSDWSRAKCGTLAWRAEPSTHQ